MRTPVLILLATLSAWSQEQAARVEVKAGEVLRIALEERVRIGSVGSPLRGRLIEPVYAFDRMVLPAGAIVEGRLAEIERVPAARRVLAALGGDLTPARVARAQFDTAVLNDGTRLTLSTEPARGAERLARVAPRGKSAVADRFRGMHPKALLSFREPGKLKQAQARLLAMLPYRRQSWPAGTAFVSVLRNPVMAPSLPAEPGSGELEARLLTKVSSATARVGDRVEAAVTRPVFGADGALLVPEGSRLHGEVTAARKARFFQRSGKLHFIFRQIEPPIGAPRPIQGYLEGIDFEASAHLALDSEGTALVSRPKSRFIVPALATAAAGLSFHQDYNAQGVPDQDYWGRAQSGAAGMGLVGMAVGQASRKLASGIAIAGAGMGIYSTLIARGAEVEFPVHTLIRINLGERTPKK
ncbi:MAG: hypothetical protein U0Q16_29255 [Bryobacteraceae bacterium]